MQISAKNHSIKTGKNIDISGKKIESCTAERQQIIALQIWVENASTNVATLMLETLCLIQSLSKLLAEHSHSNHGRTPNNSAAISQIG